MRTFNITPNDKEHAYYGFTLKDDPLHVMPDGSIFHNSGKSVCLNTMISHMSKYHEHFQVVGIDLKRVEFNLYKGVKSVKAIQLDCASAAHLLYTFRNVMDERQKFLQSKNVNNIYKVKEQTVNYYEYGGETYQFDELFELTQDLDPKDKNYNKLLQSFPDGRIPTLMTIEQIYNGLKEHKFANPQMPEMKGVNSYVDENSIRKTSGIFKPKQLVAIIDEATELMMHEDYKSVEVCKNSITSILNLGRASAVHVVIQSQRPSNQVVSPGMKQAIQMKLLFGTFEGDTSMVVFDEDVSHLCKPMIKGRGFAKVGASITELQGYFAPPENTLVFDENLRMTYNNEYFLKQKEIRGEPVDDSGFVPQYMLDQKPSATIEPEKPLKPPVRNWQDEDEEKPQLDFKFSDRRVRPTVNKPKEVVKEQTKPAEPEVKKKEPMRINIRLKPPS